MIEEEVPEIPLNDYPLCQNCGDKSYPLGAAGGKWVCGKCLIAYTDAKSAKLKKEADSIWSAIE